MSSLSYRIRMIVQDAERFLAQPEIYSALKGRLPNANVFCVEIAQMLQRKQLRRRRATIAVRKLFPGIHYLYGPGPAPVYESRAVVDRPKKMVGFMEMARMREAKAKQRRRAA